MSKQKKATKPEHLPELIQSGELFVRETYLRLYRQKHGFTTEQAIQKFESELRLETIVKHDTRAEIQIYKKV